MADTESIARLKLKTAQRIKTIMEEARKREAEHLLRSQTVRNRKAHYLRLAEDEITLAKQMRAKLLFRVQNIPDPKNERKLKKLLEE